MQNFDDDRRLVCSNAAVGAGGSISKKSTKNIDDIISARRQEIESTLAEMVEIIDQYSLVCPFSFLDARESSPAEYLFDGIERRRPERLFSDWNDKWLCNLFPRAAEAQQKMDAKGGMHDETIDLVVDIQHFGFVLGMLVGMKASGASKEELLRRSQGFVIPTIGHARYQAESDANKSGEVRDGN